MRAGIVIFALIVLAACGRSGASDGDASLSGTAQSARAISTWPSVSVTSNPDAGGAPRSGMAWIPAGTLRAGTPPGKTPRVPDEEMSGGSVDLGGFYIDLLPWPNEPNAIPTSNVSRDEAEQLCVSKGKRLCTELEWERACKGPDNTTYEYGDAYRKDVCGTGVALEQASRRPTGEHAQCKSGFGVSEMHGGVWEWTASAWGRGSRDAAQGVLRGGNSLAGELAGRCSNAIARAPSKKSPTMGLRCCAGPKNGAEVKLDLHGTPGLTVANASSAAPFVPAIAGAVGSGGAIEPKSLRAWTWTPVANEELVVALGCSEPPRSCGLVVTRPPTDGGTVPEPLVSFITGRDFPEVTRGADGRHLRVRALDAHGVFSRELTYLYGRVELGPPKRP